MYIPSTAVVLSDISSTPNYILKIMLNIIHFAYIWGRDGVCINCIISQKDISDLKLWQIYTQAYHNLCSFCLITSIKYCL